jgi:hypothetical protein
MHLLNQKRLSEIRRPRLPFYRSDLGRQRGDRRSEGFVFLRLATGGGAHTCAMVAPLQSHPIPLYRAGTCYRLVLYARKLKRIKWGKHTPWAGRQWDDMGSVMTAPRRRNLTRATTEYARALCAWAWGSTQGQVRGGRWRRGVSQPFSLFTRSLPYDLPLTFLFARSSWRWAVFTSEAWSLYSQDRFLTATAGFPWLFHGARTTGRKTRASCWSFPVAVTVHMPRWGWVWPEGPTLRRPRGAALKRSCSAWCGGRAGTRVRPASESDAAAKGAIGPRGKGI